MMHGSVDGDNSAGARKALAKVQRLLQLASAKRHALALRDYREALDECLKAEASAAMKILGFRLAARAPTCTTHDVWQLLLDAVVAELAGSQNAAVLLHAVPLLEQLPLPLVVGFLIASDKEPMNKLRAVLTHEQSDVRCCAISTLAKVTLDAAVGVASDALFAFPFESHESRIVCQQDLWTVVTDVWKIIFQSLALDEPTPHQADVAAAAFSAMRSLFARTAAMAPFTTLALHGSVPLAQTETPAQSAANDLAASVYKETAPRIGALVACAQRLPVKCQVEAAWWVAMLLSMMMDRSGARCAGISVPYLEIDVLKTSAHDNDDDDEAHATTERVRIDALASGVLEAWLLPLLGRRIPLAQSAALCRGVFVLLAHPLQAFARLKAAAPLAQQLIAQCYFHKSAETKLEMSHLLVRASAWLTSNDCVALFPRIVEAVHLMERETDRHDLLQLLMDGICHRVTASRDFLLLESIAAMDVFRQPSGTSKLSPRSSGSHVYRALVQALVSPSPTSPRTLMERQVAQLIVLKAFIQVLLFKANASVFARPQHDAESQDVLCYMALLSDHFQRMLRSPNLALKESLLFYQQDLQRAWKQITSCPVRLQLVRIGVLLQERYTALSTATLLELMNYEVSQSFASSEDERELSVEAMAASSSSAVFDDGKLGGGSVHGAIYGDPHAGHRDEHSVATAVAVAEILKAMHALDADHGQDLQQLQAAIRSFFTTHVGMSSLQVHILGDSLAGGASPMDSVFAFEVFHPAIVFQPARHQPLASPSHQGDSDGIPAPMLVTGSADPLALHVAYHQPVPGHEDVIALNVSCCNTSNLALSDFEIHIRPRGPVRCVDASNDLKIRVQQGGAGMSSSLPPFGVLKAEKRFLIQRFAQVSFYFQVVFHEADTAGGDEPVAIRVAPPSPFTVNFEALFRRPPEAVASGAFFQQIWHSAEDSTVFGIEGSHDAGKSLSLGQALLKSTNPRVAVVADLLVDLPMHTQLCFVTKTRWDEHVAVSLTLSSASSSSAAWVGICEIRSSKAVIAEMASHQSDALTVVCGSNARVVKRAASNAAAGDRTASRTASRPSSRTASSTVPAADPFAASGFPSADLTTALGQAPVATGKWDASPPSNGFGGASTSPFGEHQVRPTEPPGFSTGFGDFGAAPQSGFTVTGASTSGDPWGF